MNASEIKELVEGYQDLITKQKVLETKLDRLGGRNPLLEESYINKLSEIEQQIEILDQEIFESTILTDRESTILLLKTNGYSLVRIGEVFGVTYESIRKSLEKIYKKVAKQAA